MLRVNSVLYRFPGDCSEEQLQALDDFRGFVTNLNGGKLRA